MSESHVIPNLARRGAMVPADNASSDAGFLDTSSRDASSLDGGSLDATSFDTGSFDTASSETAAPEIAVPETASAESSSTHRPAMGAADSDRGGVDGSAAGNAALQDTADRSTLAGSDSASVRRGIQRLFARYGVWLLPEMPLRNGRRADLMGVDAQGRVIIIEIKVQRGDLLGDSKWQDYLDYCDRFFWGVSADIDRTILDRDIFRPDRCGIVVADGYDGEIVRPASLKPLAPARRKTETERLARAAMRRMTVATDPHCATWGGSE